MADLHCERRHDLRRRNNRNHGRVRHANAGRRYRKDLGWRQEKGGCMNEIAQRLWNLTHPDSKEAFEKAVAAIVDLVEDKKQELRRNYAMAAMTSIFLPNAKTFAEHAKNAFEYADAMMKAEGWDEVDTSNTDASTVSATGG